MNVKNLNGSSAFNALSDGISRGRESLVSAAQKIATNNGESAGSRQFNQALVDARQAATQIEASAKALERVDDILGQFIDTRV